LKQYLLSIDQGTTGTTVIIFDDNLNLIAKAYSEFTQIYPQPSWIEHDPLEILDITYNTMNQALQNANLSYGNITTIGITNQRETIIAWDSDNGKPIYNAIVWQCRRTGDYCQQLKDQDYASMIKQKTGLLIDPYFSASKINWILKNCEQAQQLLVQKRLMIGTIDSWLIYNLTGRKVHVTDHSNASRTQLYNIHDFAWDSELLDLFEIPIDVLPNVKKSASIFGYLDQSISGPNKIPISGVAGDQQAALFGQCCFQNGEIKNTIGTGSFILFYLGEKALISDASILTTICCDPKGNPAYAIEGSIFVAGAAIKWLQEELLLIDSPAQTETIAQSVANTGGVYCIPAFAGLGAPYWNHKARGAVVGITRGSNRNHIVRSVLESIAYQSKDLIINMQQAFNIQPKIMKVDGGVAQNNFLLQFMANLLNLEIERPSIVETTAQGAAMLAGLGIKIWNTAEDLISMRQVEKKFPPVQEPEQFTALYNGWKKAVKLINV